MPVSGVSGSTVRNDSPAYNPDHLPEVPEVPEVPEDGYAYNPSYSVTAPSKDLTSTDFLKLLAAQLQYQDMTNPMSNSEMMSTMTQMASMNATTSMTAAMSTMTSSMNDVLTVNLTSYATGMMGKEVTISLLDKDGKPTGEKVTGVVNGISLYEGSPMVYVDGKGYDLAQVMSIGDVPAQTEKDDETEGGDKQEGQKTQRSQKTGNA